MTQAACCLLVGGGVLMHARWRTLGVCWCLSSSTPRLGGGMGCGQLRTPTQPNAFCDTSPHDGAVLLGVFVLSMIVVTSAVPRRR